MLASAYHRRVVAGVILRKQILSDVTALLQRLSSDVRALYCCNDMLRVSEQSDIVGVVSSKIKRCTAAPNVCALTQAATCVAWLDEGDARPRFNLQLVPTSTSFMSYPPWAQQQTRFAQAGLKSCGIQLPDGKKQDLTRQMKRLVSDAQTKHNITPQTAMYLLWQAANVADLGSLQQASIGDCSFWYEVRKPRVPCEQQQ